MTERRTRKDNHPVKITQFSNVTEKEEEKEENDYEVETGYSTPFYEKNKYKEYPYEDSQEEEKWKEGTRWEEWPEEMPRHYTYSLKKEKKKKRAKERNRKKAKFRVCTNCGTTTTPSWRRSTNNKMLLCNACGLYQKLHGTDRPFSVTADGKTKAIKTNIEKGVCRGCGVSQTPLWRRGYNNEWLCSSCSLLYSRKERREDVYQMQDEWKGYSEGYNEGYQVAPQWKEYNEPQEQSEWTLYQEEDKPSEIRYGYDEGEKYQRYHPGPLSSPRSPTRHEEDSPHISSRYYRDHQMHPHPEYSYPLQTQPQSLYYPEPMGVPRAHNEHSSGHHPNDQAYQPYHSMRNYEYDKDKQ
ncbi:hypothetical protein NEOKW01_1757 [Nematocida sp. AWRm80]|nr:hypothetical protein NEOKW01_1757 [Nematocida sp. AWRm80]